MQLKVVLVPSAPVSCMISDGAGMYGNEAVTISEEDKEVQDPAESPGV